MAIRSTIIACLSFSLASALACPARAQEDTRVGLPSRADAPWEARIAYRGAFVESAGYAPFSTDDYFSQLTLGASRLVVSRGRFALTAGVDWDYGASDGSARGQSSWLDMNRFTAPLTIHYAIFSRFDVQATIAPGAAYLNGGVQDASAPAQLVTSAWVPCGDASAGVAWALADSSIWGLPLVFRVTLESGYAWAGRMSLSMSPDLPTSDPRRTGATDLGELAMSGAFGRMGLAVAF